MLPGSTAITQKMFHPGDVLRKVNQLRCFYSLAQKKTMATTKKTTPRPTTTTTTPCQDTGIGPTHGVGFHGAGAGAGRPAVRLRGGLHW